MKIKIAEAPKQVIDFLVAKCEGAVSDDIDDFCLSVQGEFAYSTDWAQGSPIIDREEIAVWPDRDTGNWFASANEGCGVDFSGPTLLIAAMRCYVASKLGDEVDVPEELCTP